jgi:hypothetical protein
MNAIEAAIDDVAEGICGALEKIAYDVMFDTAYKISDRLTLIKAALCLKKFLAEDDDYDPAFLFPILKDFDDMWDTDDYFEFAEKFVTFTESLYLHIV